MKKAKFSLQDEKKISLFVMRLKLFSHLGCSISFLSRVHLSNNDFGIDNRSRRSIELHLRGPGKTNSICNYLRLAFIPKNENPGQRVNSLDILTEYSLFTSVLKYHYGDLILSGLSLEEIVRPYDMYVNLRGQSRQAFTPQLRIESAYYIAREIANLSAVIAHCKNCEINYYSSDCQMIKNGCPFCRAVGEDDVFGIEQGRTAFTDR